MTIIPFISPFSFQISSFFCPSLSLFSSAVFSSKRKKEKERKEAHHFQGALDFLYSLQNPINAMAFASFLGRVLFASLFILSAYQEFNDFGVDGGPASKALRPKFDAFAHRVHSQVGFQIPEIDMKVAVAAAILLKGVGGVLFIFGSTSGALLLLLHQLIATPIRYDFYNFDSEDKDFTQLFIKFTENMALFGALLFFIGMKNSIPKRQPKKAPKTKTY